MSVAKLVTKRTKRSPSAIVKPAGTLSDDHGANRKPATSTAAAVVAGECQRRVLDQPAVRGAHAQRGARGSRVAYASVLP